MLRPLRSQIRATIAVVAVLLAGACEDPATPTVPTEETAPVRGVIACRADVVAGAISCQGPTPDPAPGLALSTIVGGQGTYVQLTSNNVSYASGIFEADVTVQNLMAQPMGTPDGIAVTGIRVFFHSGPTVTSGTGTVTVANADGTGTFTGATQPYFEYDEILQHNEVSAAKTWRWSVPSTVGTFEFSVYVDTDIQLLDVWKFRYEHQSSNLETVITAVLLPEQNGEDVGGDARRVVKRSMFCDQFGCDPNAMYNDTTAQTPLTGSIRGSQVELRFQPPTDDLTVFTGTYHPVRDSMGGEDWYAIRSSDPAPPTVAAPTGLIAAIDPGPAVRLDWIDNSSNELGFRLYRSCMGEQPVEFDSTFSDWVRWWDFGLYDHYGQSCSYSVQAFMRDGSWGIIESEPSNVAPVDIPIGAVTGIEPSEGWIGTAAIVTGLDFGTDWSVLDVTVMDLPSRIFATLLSPTQIKILMPNAIRSGRVPVTIWKNGQVYGEAAWTQRGYEDLQEDLNNDESTAPLNLVPVDRVGSFAWGDWQDWRAVPAPMNDPLGLEFVLVWNTDGVSGAKDLDLRVMDGSGSYDICGGQGVGSGPYVWFQCAVQDDFGQIKVQVIDEDAHSQSDTRPVSYRLIIQVPAP
jgi:hypothetical protein